MSYCPLCKDYMLFPNSHKCPPLWETRDENCYEDDEWTERYARDADSAAEKHAEEYDSDGDYYLVRGGTLNVEVRRQGSEDSEWFECYGESVPQYRSAPIPPPQTVAENPAPLPNTDESKNHPGTTSEGGGNAAE